MLNLDATEEKFNPEIFHKIVNKSVEPVIDLFASRIIRNTDHDTQNQVLCQWRLFTYISYFNMFPPFSLMWRVLTKAYREKTE